MRGAAGEAEVGAGIGERGRHHHFPEAVGMPGQRDVGIIERARADHEGFRRAAFFRGTAVIAYASRHLVGGKPVLHRGGGKQRSRAEQVMAAAMAMAAGLDRAMFRGVRFLAEAGQRVVFAEEGDHRTAFAPFAHHGGGNAGDLLGDTKALVAEFGQMLGGGAHLGVADFGHAPDPVGKRGKARLDRVDAAPDVTAVIHVFGPQGSQGKQEAVWLAVSPADLKLQQHSPLMHDRGQSEQE